MAQEKMTPEWLKDLGAFRPMAPCSSEVLVLGKFHDGYYPIEWSRTLLDYRDKTGKRYMPTPIEEWRVFGVLTREPLTEKDCKRILNALQGVS
jgi:hypothetical protein